MKINLYNVLLTVLFHFGMITILQAQDKYNYAVIDYHPAERTLQISINGQEYRKIDVPKDKVKGSADVNAALEEMDKLIEDGWELFDTETSCGGTCANRVFVFYLRKK